MSWRIWKKSGKWIFSRKSKIKADNKANQQVIWKVAFIYKKKYIKKLSLRCGISASQSICKGNNCNIFG